VYKKGDYYAYDGYFMRGMLLHFINRVINPVVVLKTELDIDRFIDSAHEWEEQTEFYKDRFEGIGDYYSKMGKRVRVIGFFHDKKEYKNEYRLLQEAAQALSGRRDDLRVATVSDKALVKVYKERWGARWFDQYSLNSIVLERESGDYVYYDLEKESEDLTKWINRMSLKKTGDEINRESLAIAKSLGFPHVYLYHDSSVDSRVALDIVQ